MGASVSFDRVADRYDATRGGEKRGRELAEELLPRLVPGRTLEVGVGTGVVSAALAGLGVTSFGVDLSAEMLSRATERLPGRVVQGDAHSLPFRGRSIENVLFIWSLHLVGDRRIAFAEAERVLSPEGRVLAIHGPPKYEQTDLNVAMAPLEKVRTTLRPDEDDALDEAAATAGLVPIGHEWTAGYPIPQSPIQAADEIEERTWSFLWRLDETAWQESAVPAIAALRALPEPDRARISTHWHRVSAFKRP